MRKDPFGVGDLIHVYNRGNRKQEIVRDDIDRWRFVQMLFYFNTKNTPPNPMKTAQDELKSDFNRRLLWPKQWPERDPLVDIIAFILMDNHLHLILKEIREGGVTEFMRKLGTGMTNRFNTRYDEVGRLLQGAYKARLIDKDTYLQYLAVYIHITNAFELYPGGFGNAVSCFDDAFEFAINYPYSSLGVYLSNNHPAAPVIETEMLEDIIKNKEEFKELAKNCIEFVHFNDKKILIEV